jgi:hypothetical protein
MKAHKKREEENGAQKMTGQHSGYWGCFYTQEGYIVDVLQVIGEVNRSKQKSNIGGPYGDRHWRRKSEHMKR